jgi:isopentenyl diphosphate isomerase/L-lactate dehydrogenase-like FMN-dependent dehydrogenase
VLEILRREIDRVMALGGWNELAAINRDTVRLVASPAVSELARAAE